MTIKEIAKPALLIAPDGWVETIYKPDDLSTWSVGATKRYNEMGLSIFSANERMWGVKRFIIHEKPTFFDSLRWFIYIGTPAPARVELELEEISGDVLQDLMKQLERLISKDNDLLTQFSTKEDLLRSLRDAKDVKDVIKRLKKLRAIN